MAGVLPEMAGGIMFETSIVAQRRIKTLRVAEVTVNRFISAKRGFRGATEERQGSALDSFPLRILGSQLNLLFMGFSGMVEFSVVRLGIGSNPSAPRKSESRALLLA